MQDANAAEHAERFRSANELGAARRPAASSTHALRRSSSRTHARPGQQVCNRTVLRMSHEPINNAIVGRARQAQTAPGGSRSTQLMRLPEPLAAARAGHKNVQVSWPMRMCPQPGSLSSRPGAAAALAPAEAGRRARRGGPKRAGGQAHRPRAAPLGDGAVAQQRRRKAQLGPRGQWARMAPAPRRDAQRRAQRVAQLARGLAARQQRRDRRGRGRAPVLRGPAEAAGARAVSGTCGLRPLQQPRCTALAAPCAVTRAEETSLAGARARQRQSAAAGRQAQRRAWHRCRQGTAPCCRLCRVPHI